MLRADQFGYDLNMATDAPLAPWTRTVDAFLSHASDTASALGATLEADPDMPMALTAKGFFMLLLGRAELRETARAAHDALAERMDMLTARERGAHAALGLYLAGRIAPAADRLDETLKSFPRDALLVKIVHAMRFVLGDAAGMRRSIDGVIGAYDDSHRSYGYMLGCQAFAYEESGERELAERIGRRGVEIAPDDAWGLHAVAHVMEMQARPEDGIRWIRGSVRDWSHTNNFKEHIWWHLALFHLDRGETREVLRLYDEEIRANPTDDYRDIANGASLLTRLELDGVDVGARWEELAELSAHRADDGSVVFADLHYMLAIEAKGDEAAAARLQKRLAEASTRRMTCMDAVAASAGAPAAEGLRAFARGDYAAAYARLAAAQPHLPKIGGSWAQRDVFERVTIEAALRAGLCAEARRALHARGHQRGAQDNYARTRLERLAALEEPAA